MDTRKDQLKSIELQNILFDLACPLEIATNRETLLNMYMRLETFYCGSDSSETYRHLYSDIFSTLIALHNNPQNGDIQTLVQNLRYIRENYRPERLYQDKTLIDISESVRKLYDHVNLEIARLDYYDVHRDMSELSEQVSLVDSEIKGALEKQRKFGRKAKQFEKKLADTQKEYISILGIFSAVVLAFVGGSIFSSSVLESMSSTNIYRVIFVVDFLAFVVVSLVYLLVMFILRVNEMPGENIPVFIKKQGEVKDKRKKENFFPIRTFCIICFAVALLDIVAWIIDFGTLASIVRSYLPWMD